LRHRAGADVIDIDTFAGTCRLWYTEPREIDFAVIEQASLDSSYKLVEIRLDVLGEIRDGGGRPVFMTPVGQRFEFEGVEGLEGAVHLHTRVEDWREGVPRLKVEFGHPRSMAP